jgi:hypothetical protein
VNQSKRDCPQCKVTLTKYEWSRLWWMSAGMSGRLVQPCPECGALLRLSGMRLLSALGALGLLISSITLAVSRSEEMLFVALLFAILIFVGVLATRVEVVLQTTGSGSRA